MSDLLSDVRHDLRFATRVLRMSLKDARAWVARGYGIDLDEVIPPPPPARSRFADGTPCRDCGRPTREARRGVKEGIPEGWTWRGNRDLCSACASRRRRARR